MASSWLWMLFAAVFVVALFLDLFVFQRKAHAIPVKEALKLVAFWIALAAVFNIVIYFVMGSEKGLLFTTAYLIEYSLSVDNLFVFLAIFTYFAVPKAARRKVFLWGILGAIFFRGIFIFAGITLIERFHFLVYILGLMLIYTAIKLVTQREKEVNPEKNPVVRLARRFMRCESQYDGNKFFSKVNGSVCVTPLIIVLVAIEITDVMFAIDSVPAVLGVTLDPFIVYTSNIFAILGLRALYFVVAGMMQGLCYLSYGLCALLVFIGVKLLLSDILPIPTGIALAVTAGILLVSILSSVLRRRQKMGNVTSTCVQPIAEEPDSSSPSKD